MMVGGGGERKTLRLVAKYADACNVFAGRGTPRTQVAHKLEVLRGWCEAEGRPYDEIRRTVLWNAPIAAGPGRSAPPSSTRCAPWPTSACRRCT